MKPVGTGSANQHNTFSGIVAAVLIVRKQRVRDNNLIANWGRHASERDMMAILQQHGERMAGSLKLFKAENMSVRLGPRSTDKVLFSGVSLEVSPNDVIDLVGPSGSGKTTLLSALARLHPYASGDLTLNGIPASAFTPTHWRTHVALLPQKAAFAPGSVGDNLLLPFMFADKKETPKPTEEAMSELLAEVGLADIALAHSIDRLSVGQMARIAFCRTLLTKPDVLLLDEVDAALDVRSVERIGALVARYVSREGRSCIRIRHREADEYTTRRMLFSQGVLTEEVF